jgi:hypothetical protein
MGGADAADGDCTDAGEADCGFVYMGGYPRFMAAVAMPVGSMLS